MLKTLARRLVLIVMTAVLAFSWGGGGGLAQSLCLVERGQDPLDILKADVRHNVWISLDTSGSMNDRMDGTNISGTNPEDTADNPATTTVNEGAKLRIAKDVLNGILDEFVDAAGNPVFNWGFVYFDPANSPDTSSACGSQFTNSSCIGYASAKIFPPGCLAANTVPSIKAKLALKASGGVAANGYTPNGKSLDSLTSLSNSWAINPSTLLLDQKNFIIHITDGEDTCECDTALFNNPAANPKNFYWDSLDKTKVLTLADDALVLNPGFETAGGSSADATNWTEATNHARVNDKSNSGSRSLKSTDYTATLRATTSGAIAVVPNTDYTFSAYIYRTNTSGSSYVDMSDIAGELQLNATSSGTWQRVTGSWNSGARTSVTLRCVTQGLGASKPVWFDDISLVADFPATPPGTYRSGYNAGLKAQLAYSRLNPTAADQATAEKGDIFVIGLGQQKSAYTTGTVSVPASSATATFAGGASIPSTIGAGSKIVIASTPAKTFYVKTRDSSTQLTLQTKNTTVITSKPYVLNEGVEFVENTHHLAWQASGIKYGRPGRGAYPATNPQQLKDALRDALSTIGVINRTITMGASVVGSVPELIPVANSTITPNDVLASTSYIDDAREARVNRIQHRNNIMFSTSVETVGFKGHLKAFNVFKVTNPGQTTETRTVDDRPGGIASLPNVPLWDAGEKLRQRDAANRTILFNRRGSTNLVSFTTANVTATDIFGATGAGVGYLSELDGIGALNDAAAVAMVVQVLRGKRLSLHPTTDPAVDAGRGKLYKPVSQCATPSMSNDYCLNFSELLADNVTKTWKLYDPTAAGVAIVQYPGRSPDGDPPQLHMNEYAPSFGNGFYWDNINRQTVVFMGTNGGMVHAFAGDNGEELYAIITDDVLGPVAGELADAQSKLKDVVKLIVPGRNGITNHKFFYSAAATVDDAFFKTDNKWHTVVTIGRGRGGKYMTALDVSSVGDWDGNTTGTNPIPVGDYRLPTLRWNKGNTEGLQDGPTDEHALPSHGIYDDFGETWSTPVVGNVKLAADDDQWVVFVGAGYGCSGSQQGEFLYVMKVEDGTVYQRVGGVGAATRPLVTVAGAQITHNQLVAVPALYNPHESGVSDSTDFVTRVYIGDLQGNVYKLDTSSTNPGQWTFKVLYALGKDQPITAQAATMKVPGLQNQVLVFLGTGGDQRASPPLGQNFYLAGIADNDAEGQNNPGTLIQSVDAQGNTVQFRIPLPNTPPSTERLMTAPVVVVSSAPASGVVYFASTLGGFTYSTCKTSYSSRLWAFRVTTGQPAFDMDPSTQGTQSSVSLGGGKVAGLFAREEHLYVTRTGGLDIDSSTDVKGSQNFPVPTTGAAGTVQVFTEKFGYSAF